jgi:glycosyltransferase involved in cell wall biosynthesis
MSADVGVEAAAPLSAGRRAALSVVVPTRDRVELLAGCLAALRADLTADDELIVADSASVSGEQVAAVAARFGARVVRCPRPGASRARNLGWQASSHELVGFVDDDVRVWPGWAGALVAAFDDDAIGFVTGRVVVPDSQRDAERPVAVTSRATATPLHPGLDGDLGASANLGVRRSALDRAGGFDETLGPGTWASSAEDLDLFDRLFQAGTFGLFEPAVCAEHDQWRSRRQLIALDWRYGKGMGVRLARLARWDRPRARRLLWEAVITQGLTCVARDLRHGYEFGAVTVSTRILATVVGVVAGVMRGGAA